jgi:hypothetical protein
MRLFTRFFGTTFASLREQLQVLGCGIEITLLSAVPAGSEWEQAVCFRQRFLASFPIFWAERTEHEFAITRSHSNSC